MIFAPKHGASKLYTMLWSATSFREGG